MISRKDLTLKFKAQIHFEVTFFTNGNRFRDVEFRCGDHDIYFLSPCTYIKWFTNLFGRTFEVTFYEYDLQ